MKNLVLLFHFAENKLRLRGRGMAPICFSLFLIGLVVSACEKEPPTTALGNEIRIEHVTPTLSQQLRPGEYVQLRVVATYKLDADKGAISLVVQTADNLAIANDAKLIGRGEGKITMESQFVVPKTNAIHIYAALSAPGQKTTQTVDFRTFNVGPGA